MTYKNQIKQFIFPNDKTFQEEPSTVFKENFRKSLKKVFAKSRL